MQRPLFTGTPAQILQSMQRYQEVGVQDFRVDFPSPSVDGLLPAMERFATEVRPQVQARPALPAAKALPRTG